MLEPCETWPVIWACDPSCLSPIVTGQALEVATEVLWGLSGRQFGYCQTTIRPCRRTCNDMYQAFWGDYMYPLPALIGGQWFNLTCGVCTDTCSCTELSEAVLPATVSEIISVKLDGTPLVTGAYRVDNGNVLVRTDGGRWPYCQDMSKPDSAAGTWSVTAKYGAPVPAAGQLAVGELACELSKLLSGDSTCRLPRGVTQVQRQGVTISYEKVADAMKEGGLGMFLVDLFVTTFNPNHLQRGARVYNVDAPQPRMQTWP